MKHKLKPDTFGKCIACDTDTADKIPGGLKINEHYRERKFKLSNYSVMRVAFCDKCEGLVKKRDFGWIMKNVISGWEVTLNEPNKTEEQRQKYRDSFYKLKITGFYNGVL